MTEIERQGDALYAASLTAMAVNEPKHLKTEQAKLRARVRAMSRAEPAARSVADLQAFGQALAERIARGRVLEN